MNFEPGIVGTLLENELNGETPFLARLLDYSPESFDDPRAGQVAAEIKRCHAKGIPAHPAEIIERLKFQNALGFVADCQKDALTPGHAEFEAEKLWRNFQARRSYGLLQEGMEALTAHPEMATDIRARIVLGLQRLDSQTFNGLPEIVDAKEFLSQSLPMPPELIAGLLHKGSKMALGGNSKAFKTWLLLHMAIAVSTGIDWLGFPTTRGKVLLVNLEIQPAPMQGRIAAVTRASEIELTGGQLQVWNLRGHAADFRQLIPKIIARAKSEGYALIILDPIYKLYGGTDENAAGDVAALLNAVERVTVETGAAVAYGCHFAKGNASSKEAIDRISGSGVFARDPDSLVIFTAHETEGSFTAETILRNFPPVAPFVVSWQFPLMQRDENLDPSKLKQVAGKKKEHDPVKLLAAIANNDEQNPISLPAWSERTGMARTTLNDYVTEMRRKNWVKTVGEGRNAKQAITNTGKEVLREH